MICFRKTYYKDTLFNVGDPLPPGMKPNKFFSPDGLPPRGAVPTANAADDPRSTVQIFLDLKARGIEMPAEATRKDLYVAWIKTEQERARGGEKGDPNADQGKPDGKEKGPESTKTPPPSDGDDKTNTGPTKDDPLGGKLFREMTPDDIHGARRDDISEALKLRHGIDVNPNGRSKEQLVEMGIRAEHESRHVDPTAGTE